MVLWRKHLLGASDRDNAVGGGVNLKTQSGSRKIAVKTLERVKKLIWLAAQDVRGWVTGCEVYQRQELARLCGVKPDNWSHNYANYWREMCDIF